MNQHMLFLEKETIDFIAERLRENPGFIDLELPGLRKQNPSFFMFFDHFSHGKDRAAAFNAAVLTYLSFQRQLQLLRERGQVNIVDFPKITNSVVNSLTGEAVNDDSWGNNILQSMQDQNSFFLDFMIRYSARTRDAEAVAQCFLFAYGLLDLQLFESKETYFAVPKTCLQ